MYALKINKAMSMDKFYKKPYVAGGALLALGSALVAGGGVMLSQISHESGTVEAIETRQVPPHAAAWKRRVPEPTFCAAPMDRPINPSYTRNGNR